MQRDRGYGQGVVRIGTIIGVGDDIYSLGFISQISDEIMDKHFDVIKGELIEEEKEEQEDTEEAEPSQNSASLNAEVPVYTGGDQY